MDRITITLYHAVLLNRIVRNLFVYSLEIYLSVYFLVSSEDSGGIFKD